MSEQETLFEIQPKWKDVWQGMPDYEQQDKMPFKSIKIHFRNRQDQDTFAALIGQKIGEKTQYIWFPEAKIGHFSDKRYVTRTPVSLKYPVFVPTKGRHDTRYTIKMLEALGVPYKAVVEPQECDAYSSVIPKENILVLPFRDRGLVVTRNWIWDYAESLGVERFWTFDDNIRGLYRLTKNLKTPCTDAAILKAIEDFADRYENLVIAGCNYFMFAKRKDAIPPIILNTRVYSNMLIQTMAKDSRGNCFRNEGFFNDDTDLCLRVLKDGKCTALFNTFLIFKSTTMTVKGGMTGHYQGDGRYKMAEELANKHPDVVTITRKWNRWQHQVDYRPFRKNKLILKPGVVIPEETNNYGMELQIDGE